jgi:hypothetical protein
MSEKTDVIVAVLEEQADKQDAIAAAKLAESFEHKGAAEILELIQKKVIGISGEIENLIENDKELSGDTAVTVLVKSRQYLALVVTAIDKNRMNQKRQRILREGEGDQAKTTARDFRKQAAAKKAAADKREAEADANRKKNGTTRKKPAAKKTTRKKASPKKPASKRAAKR